MVYKKQAMKSKPGSITPLWPVFLFLPPHPCLGSCCDFPQRQSDLRNPFLPKLLMVIVLNHSHRNAKTGDHPGIQKLRKNMKEVLTNPHRQCQVIKNSTQGDLDLNECSCYT